MSLKRLIFKLLGWPLPPAGANDCVPLGVTSYTKEYNPNYRGLLYKPIQLTSKPKEMKKSLSVLLLITGLGVFSYTSCYADNYDVVEHHSHVYQLHNMHLAMPEVIVVDETTIPTAVNCEVKAICVAKITTETTPVPAPYHKARDALSRMSPVSNNK